MEKYSIEKLQELQALPLEEKVRLTQTRIMEFSQHCGGKVYVSFSGGKDSTVLLDIARRILPDIPAVFFNTGLEYPEIQEFVKTKENVTELRPTWGRMGRRYGHKPDDLLTFRDTLLYIGYPIISKQVSEAINGSRRLPGGSLWRCMHGMYQREDGRASMFDYQKYLPVADLPVRISKDCCTVNKKRPAKMYGKESGAHPVVATMATESVNRRNVWLAHGCNIFDTKAAKSNPLSFWQEQDVLEYIKKTGLPICSVYGEIEECDGKLRCTGCDRTGCIFCGFGLHLEKGETRFQRMKRTHPRLYEYCLDGGEFHENENYDPTLPAERWNPRELWGPSRSGLGMAKVFDWMNDIYGKDFYRYE